MYKRLFKNNKRFGDRVREASILILSGFIINQVIRFAGNLILTRLLLPEYFGIMGIVTVILMGVVMFSDLGFRQIVVSSSSIKNEGFLDTAWTVQCIRGILLGTLVLLLGIVLQNLQEFGILSIDTVYGDPMLPKVMLVSAIIPVISGMESIYVFVANRKLEMKKVTISELSSQFVGLIIMVFGAWATQSIWSIVAGSIVASTFKTFLTHVLFLPSKVRFRLKTEYVKEIIKYGKWILLASISGFLLNQGDRLILGGLVTAKLLGVYTIAYFLANALQLLLSRLLRLVFFPMISEVNRNDPNNLAYTFYRIRGRTDILVMFAAGFLYIIGDLIVEILYDSRYHEAGWMLQILGFSMLVTSAIVAEQVFLALGHTRWMSFASLAQTIFLYSFLPFAYSQWGLNGAIWCIAFAFIPRYLVSMYFLSKLEILSISKELKYIPLIGFGMLAGMFFKQFIDRFII